MKKLLLSLTLFVTSALSAGFYTTITHETGTPLRVYVSLVELNASSTMGVFTGELVYGCFKDEASVETTGAFEYITIPLQATDVGSALKEAVSLAGDAISVERDDPKDKTKKLFKEVSATK